MTLSRTQYLRSLLCLAGLAGGHATLRAADTAADSAPPPAPTETRSGNSATAYPENHDDAVHLGSIIVSSSPLGHSQADLAQATTVLSGWSLTEKIKPTLGDTLAQEPGINATSFGPGASRPIIRGQGGDRLKLLENGVSALDASATSPDHAVAVEPFLVRRIEIVRGPASLLYGSSAVGGVVNMLTHRIDEQAPEGRADTELMLRYDSSANSWTRGGTSDITLWKPANDAGTLVFHIDGFRRDAGDLRIPGHAESESVRAAEAAEAAAAGTADAHDHEEQEGVLPNTALTADGGAFGLSWIGGDYHLGASFSGYNTLYGVPGHEHHEDAGATATGNTDEGGEAAGVRIALRQRRADLQGAITRDLGPFTGARLKVGRVDYEHRELEPTGEVGTRFTNSGHDARFELLHAGLSGKLSGALGLQEARNRLEAQGEEAFVPSSLTQTGALFAFEEYALGALRLQAGARAEKQSITVDSLDTHRRDWLYGASLGAVWKLGGGWSLAGNGSQSSRAPNAQELFADGPHAGTGSYETGNPNLARERVLSGELSLRREKGLVTGELTVFAQRFRNHIHSDRNGLVAVEGANGFEFVQADAPGAPEGLPVYVEHQGKARYAGLELDTRVHLHEGDRHAFDLRLGGDLVRASGEDGPLPRIPNARTMAGLEWRHGDWGAGLDWTHAFRQGRVAENEAASPSYELVGATLTRCLRFRHLEADLVLRAGNLLDREIRPHTSYLRDLAPLAGRAFSVQTTLHF